MIIGDDQPVFADNESGTGTATRDTLVRARAAKSGRERELGTKRTPGASKTMATLGGSFDSNNAHVDHSQRHMVGQIGK